MDAYDSELRNIVCSGPHVLEDSHYDLNRMVKEEIQDLLPIDDIHKISDADLIFRFLIAYRWHPQKAADALRDYCDWRREMRLNTILWEVLPESTAAMLPRYHGCDLGGFPIFYDCPNPTIVADLLQNVPRETLIRAHLQMMESGRRLAKHLAVDRISCVLDMSKLTIGVVRNMSAVNLLKEFSSMDQKYYPENMRTMMITNSGWVFGTLYSVIRPFLDLRVQKKIQIIDAGKQAEDLAKWVDLAQIPVEFGGTAEFGEPNPILVVAGVPFGTFPGPTTAVQPDPHPKTPPELENSLHECVEDSAVNEAQPTNHPVAVESVLDPIPRPLPRPRKLHRAGELILHRSIFPAGVEVWTAFVLGWPMAQRCGDTVWGADNAVKCTIFYDESTGALIADGDRTLKYVVETPKLAAFRSTKLSVRRPREPTVKILANMNGRWSIDGQTYRSLNIIASNANDRRDWSAMSCTRVDEELMIRRQSLIEFRKELFSVSPALLLGLVSTINQRWPFEVQS